MYTTSANPPAPSPNIRLSVKDSHTLARLFDPESAPSINIATNPNLACASAHTTVVLTSPSTGHRLDLTIDPTGPADAHVTNPSLLEELKNKEIKAVTLAEGEQPEEGLRLLDQILTSEQGQRYASAWVNRAMCKRLVNSKRPEEERLPTTKMLNDMEVVRDLRVGICLALGLDLDAEEYISGNHVSGFFLPISADRNLSISAKQTKVLSQAYTHLGAISLMLSREEADKGKKEELEELSSKYFEVGGKLGSEIGRTLAVKTNPYAKLCGAMVKEVMKREFGGEEG